MKKSVLAIILAGIASVLAINAATAADIPSGPRPYYQAAPSAYYNWGGFYGGLNLGYQWGKVSNTNTEPSGLMGHDRQSHDDPSGANHACSLWQNSHTLTCARCGVRPIGAPRAEFRSASAGEAA